MAGFRKAKGEQAALKMGLYGPPGSGKTLTALMCAEGLAKLTGKRVAFIDTERGSDFYVQDIEARRVHPKGFDIDALYSRSITECYDAIKSLKPNEHGVIVIDSITHLWEAARFAYEGKTTSVGTIPFHAWAKIKKPYKDMINYLLSSPLHVFLCGRQGNEFAEDEDTGELKRVGVKMKAEGETPYEPHILMRMEAVKQKDGTAIITAFAEKDRTGILAGRTITWPNFDNMIKPLLGALGEKQAVLKTDDENALQDAEALAEAERNKIEFSKAELTKYKALVSLCPDIKALKDLAKEWTPEWKSQMVQTDIAELRDAYLETEKRLKS